VDVAGNAYLLMSTYSTNLPMVNPLQATNVNGPELFVAKLNRTGSAILYSTYLGGVSLELAGDIEVDSQGNAYITGSTGSAEFPVVNAIQPTINPGGQCDFPVGSIIRGRFDAFIAKLNASGSALIYSTFLGGRCSEMGLAIAVDRSGKVYVPDGPSPSTSPSLRELTRLFFRHRSLSLTRRPLFSELTRDEVSVRKWLKG
jgi:beta-propeller repeat-containing protein